MGISCHTYKFMELGKKDNLNYEIRVSCHHGKYTIDLTGLYMYGNIIKMCWNQYATVVNNSLYSLILQIQKWIRWVLDPSYQFCWY